MNSSRDTSFSSIETLFSSYSDEGKRKSKRRSSVPVISGDIEPSLSDGDKVNGDEKGSRRVKIIFPLGTKRDSLDSLREHKEEEEDMRRSSTVPDATRSAWIQKQNPRVGRKSTGTIYKDIPMKDVNNAKLLRNAVREEVHRRRLMKKFRFILRLRVLLHRWWRRHSPSEVASTHPFYMQFQMINDSMETSSENAIDFKASYFRANKQMRMSQEAKRILMMKPERRTQAEIYYAMIALRGIETIADYPLRMQQALAAHGRFESYGPKRIIVKQGHRPEGFYFILYGTVVVAILETGSPYAKTRVTLRRGENFGAEELAIAHRINRQSTVITMDKTEFLVIDCDTYENIFMAGGKKTLHDPDHNRFMRSLYFLKDFPVEKFENNPKMMHFCYFRRNTVMVEDSNNSEWIYVVKSGSLRVYKKLVKCYPTISKRTGNHHQLANTDGFLSFMSKETEYHRYAVYNDIDLPPPLCPDTDSDDDIPLYKGQSDEKENLLGLPLMQRVERLIRPRTSSGVIATYGQSSVKRNIQSAKSDGSKSRRINWIADKSPRNTPRATIQTPSSDNETTKDYSLPSNEPEHGKRTLLDDYEHRTKLHDGSETPYYTTVPPAMLKKHSSDIDPNAISKRYSKAFVTELLKKEITAADLDPEFVLVQTLTKGQAFGLQQIFCENQPSLFLVSHGAECVMLNKKFYKDHVDANMTQRLKQQISPYPSDEVLQENLETRVNWMEYRKITLRNLIKSQREGKPPRLKPKDSRAAFK